MIVWRDGPLETWEQADECRKAIRDYTGEDGEVVRVLAAALNADEEATE